MIFLSIFGASHVAVSRAGLDVGPVHDRVEGLGLKGEEVLACVVQSFAGVNEGSIGAEVGDEPVITLIVFLEPDDDQCNKAVVLCV